MTGLPLHAIAALMEAELEQRRRAANDESSTDRYALFRQRYKEDPAGFITDCIDIGGDGAYEYQLDIANRLVQNKRVCVRGPHGLGKTALSVWLMLWFALTRDVDVDWKVPSTASTWRQLSKFLWPEVHKWARRLRWDRIGRAPFDYNNELMTLSLRLKTGEAFAMASNTPALIEGAHASELLYLFDEAKTIPSAMWDAAEGAFSVGKCYWLAVSTPGDASGRFYEIHRRLPGLEDWETVHITKERMIEAGSMSVEWALQRAKQWGVDSTTYQNRVEGNFASQSEGGIPIAAIEASVDRWQKRKQEGKLGDIVGVGVDVGADVDPSVIITRSKDAVLSIEEFNASTTMETAGKIVGMTRKNKGVCVVVDAIGIGTGLVERLMETDAANNVMVFKASEKSIIIEEGTGLEFANKRAAAWWNVRKKIVKGELDIPPHDGLITDLLAMRWTVRSDGKLIARSKDEVRKEIGRSTDYGDALAMAFWGDVEEAVVVQVGDGSLFHYRGS